MRHTQINLGGHTFSMPAITLGTVRYGTRIAEAEAFKMMDAYVEAGGNWIDTARVYGTALAPPAELKPELIDSEEMIGSWLKKRGARDRVTLITKGAHWDLDTKAGRLTPACIRHDIDVSLRKLGVEQIDIYLIHHDDPSVPVEEIMPVIDDLARQGKIRVAGCSNWKMGRVLAANAFAESNGLTPFAISQIKWSYAAPAPDFPAERANIEDDPGEYDGYKRLHMPVMAYSSQAKGFFIQAGQSGLTPEGLGKAANLLTPKNKRRAEAAIRLAGLKGISVASAAFSYLWSREVPVTALVGPSTAGHLADSLRDCDYLPTAADVALLEEAL